VENPLRLAGPHLSGSISATVPEVREVSKYFICRTIKVLHLWSPIHSSTERARAGGCESKYWQRYL